LFVCFCHGLISNFAQFLVWERTRCVDCALRLHPKKGDARECN
jgi:hypothetical protein